MRGPSGTITVGVTKAIQARLAQEDPGGFRQGCQDATGMAAEELKGRVKGARPASEVEVRMDGPVDDPIQGMIYVLTVFARFHLDDLDADSPAYRDWTKDNGPR